VEEFLNLNANVRFVRLRGVLRATQYGYSLFEVEFASPGRDNTLPVKAVSPEPVPSADAALAPARAIRPPLEMVQFALADGTLVTRFGMVGRSRHARERGEDWNEIGHGPNATVDAAGNPVDRGPGAHLNFVANYFKNRTWGVEIIDNSKVAGVTRPTLTINQYFVQAQRGGGHAMARRFDDPGVTGFGWMSPGRLLDQTKYLDGLNGSAACPVVPKQPQDALARTTNGFAGVFGANDGCSVVLDNYPGHRALVPDANGVLVPGTAMVAARSLAAGDVIEFTSSFFSTRQDMDAIGDNGAFRYYTNELTYVMGVGLRPWYGVQPRLMNAPLPPETLSGGIGSVSYDYADNSQFMFQQPMNNIGMQNMQRFVEGRRWIHTNLTTGEHTEAGNDNNTQAVGLQGTRFNQSTCFACHVNNGRGVAPSVLNQRLDTMAVRTASVDAQGRQLPDPVYGMGVQMNSRQPSAGHPQDWGTAVRVAAFEYKTVHLADGTAVELRKPQLGFDGATPRVFSLRNAQPMIGMGLLEAIDDEDILSRIRSSPDADGVRGQANYVFDPETGEVRLGRYGWKASKATLRHQVASAALIDMSVTSSIYPSRECLAGPARCATERTEPGLSEDAMTALTRYLRLLAVPAQRSAQSGFPKGVTPLPALNVNPA
jgi:Di-haem oxidoreductase, putative peroxidase